MRPYTLYCTLIIGCGMWLLSTFYVFIKPPAKFGKMANQANATKASYAACFNAAGKCSIKARNIELTAS